MVDENGGKRVARIALAFAMALGVAVADAQVAVETTALPETLTRESARDLLARMSDTQVRSLLLEQLDRAAAPPKPPAETGMSAMAGMAGVVDQHAGSMRDRYTTLTDAFVALPATLRDAARRVAGNDAGALARLAAFIVAMFAAGWIVERAYGFALRHYRLRLASAAPDFTARAFQMAVEWLIEFGGLAVFGVTSILFFFAFWLGDELRRIVVLEALFGVMIVRVVARVARLLLQPSGTHPRLLPFDDTGARTLRRFAGTLATLYGLGLAGVAVLRATGASAETADVVGLALWCAGLAVTLWTVWRVRKPIAALIRGNAHGVVVGWIADLWPVAATAYFVALLLGAIFNVLAGVPITNGTGFASVVLVAALPIVDMTLCRALAAAVRDRHAPEAAGGAGLAAYEPIFRRAIHIVVLVAGLVMIAQLWDLDLFALAQRNLGGRIASSLLGIGIVVLATYMLWEIVRTAIDRRLIAEGEQPEDVPATRLRTVLPILRATILVILVAMASMSILAALGVDILPLLAGAGVVGVAIGFGSQTLVRDIVSGAFFLMDDAFRLGEYIEVGDAKGRVERINLRSVFLRHHRGALNILPYGEIKRLRNTSRDWSIHVLEFRLTYDTNMLQVKKILKQIGEELAADSDYAPDLLQPLKSAGVIAAEDSAIVVRAKFTARPTSNAWVVRRVAYDKIIRAFRAAGIRFAHRQVTVNASPDVAAAAAGAALEIPAAKTPQA
ncbi:MAG TPA: mechanosensitive ion channel domain-containing protein [Casimicrobiaceae bacterium]|nr:mechanosensitive ion channel domain-containing protein [Casimicrobiaceae bacterium]